MLFRKGDCEVTNCTCMVTTQWICLLAFSKARWARRALWILMALRWWKTADVKHSLFSALAFSNAFNKEGKDKDKGGSINTLITIRLNTRQDTRSHFNRNPCVSCQLLYLFCAIRRVNGSRNHQGSSTGACQLKTDTLFSFFLVVRCVYTLYSMNHEVVCCASAMCEDDLQELKGWCATVWMTVCTVPVSQRFKPRNAGIQLLTGHINE